MQYLSYLSRITKIIEAAEGEDRRLLLDAIENCYFNKAKKDSVLDQLR